MFAEGELDEARIAIRWLLIADRSRDRQARLAGKEAGRLPVVDADPTKPSALPTPDSYEFFSAWEKKSPWKNDNTVRRYALRQQNLNRWHHF